MYERFVQLLNEKGITAYQVYKDTGVSQSVLSAWKKGASTPRPMTLKIIADYFGVSIAWLKGETDERSSKEKPAEGIGELSEEEVDYIRWYRECATEKDRAIIKTIIEGGKS